MGKINYLKRKYTDMRFGMSQFAVVIGITNFLLISYNLTVIKDYIEFHWYALISANFFIISLIVIGKLFRVKQMSTDNTLAFAQQPIDRHRDRIILENLLEIKNHLNLKNSPETIRFLEILKKLEKKL